MLLRQLRPLTNLISGFNNNIKSNMSIIVGINNSIDSSFTSVLGSNNTIFSNSGSNTISGNNNSISGNNNSISGTFNTLNINSSLINGNFNKIESDNSFVFGNSNISISEQEIKKSLIIGNLNITNSEINIIGDSNQIVGASSSYILGNNNIILNGIIVGINDYNATGSTPSWNYNEITISENLFINGNENIIGTSSQNITIFGSNNIIGPSISNVFLVGENTTQSVSNQYIISSDKDVNIQGKMLPCDLIQDYTPISASDPYAPYGAIVKSDENLYVRTTGYGWREIPFNNSYGYFFDITNQSNPTASVARAMLIGSVSTAKNVYIANNSQITVVYSGMYNIQFSAQLEKSGGGEDSVDIWLRYNGVDVPWSNSRVTIIGNGGKAIAAWNFIQTMTASSNCELMWSSPSTGVTLYSIGTQSGPDRPGIPSLIVSIDKISSI